jgi:hypothetical protein
MKGYIAFNIIIRVERSNMKENLKTINGKVSNNEAEIK